MAEPAIKTTVVGSYPVPAWLAALLADDRVRQAYLGL